MLRKGDPRPVDRLLQWGGPAALLLALAALATLALRSPAEQSTIAVWLYGYVLTPIRLLAFLGLGLALAIIPGPIAVLAGLTALAGLLTGLHQAQPLWAALGTLSPIAPRLSLLAPLTCLAVGACLIAPAFVRRFLAPLSAFVLGLCLGLVIHLTDPYLGAPGPGLWGTGAAGWAIASIAVTARAWRRSWFTIATPILGSWLLAIGLLSGGAVLAPHFKTAPAVSPAPASAPASTPLGTGPQGDAFGTLFPDSGASDGQISGEWMPERRNDGPEQVLP